MEPSVDAYKSGTSIALGHYSTKLTTMLPPRSSKLLLLRGPAFPAQSLDLSAELAVENMNRRRMHSAILDKDPGAFRKKDRAESASIELHHRQIMKDLIGDMHQLKDFNDIDKSKKFTRSILFEKEKEDTMSLKEYQFQTMKPIEDFIRPDDQFSPRITGYEHGHIRSMLKLDVYGPAGSSRITQERETGMLPRSPNVDRHSVLSANNTRPGTGTSVASSRGSTANSTNYNGAFPSLKTLRRDRASTSTGELGLRGGTWGQFTEGQKLQDSLAELSNSRQMRSSIGGGGSQSSAARTAPGRIDSSRHSSVADQHTDRGSLGGTGAGANHLKVGPDDTVVFAGPGLRPSTTGTSSSYNNTARTGTSAHSTGRVKFPDQTFPGVAIAEEERLLGGDPFLRRTNWYKSYASSNKARAQEEEAYKKERKHVKEQRKIAEEERRRMKEFEQNLVLAKFNSQS